MASISVGGALAAAAAASTVGGIASSAISSSAASSAADKQLQAANAASALAQQQSEQTRTDLEPYRTAGSNALGILSGIFGSQTAPVPGSPGGYSNGGSNILTANGLNGLMFQPTQAELEATPGYQFTRAQGLQSVANSNAAAGRGISGAALKGAAQYATGLANNTLQTQQGIYQSNLSNILNPLEYLSTAGQNSAAQTGTLGLQGTANANALAVGGANASAAGTIGSANAISNGLNGLGSNATNYLLYSKLLNGGFGGGGGGGDFYDTTSTLANG